VECSGKSTTSGGGWSFGFIAGKAHAAGSAWVSAYLNRKADTQEGGIGDRLVSGKRKLSRYSLVRTLNNGLSMEAYPPIFPVIAKSKTVPEYKERFAGNYRQFSDFAPFLLVNQQSERFLASVAGLESYPIASFRGNIVVRSDGAWEEEAWAVVDVCSPTSARATPALTLRKIKECPRCNVPCRDELTGKFLFPDDSLKLWKVLKHVFPLKAGDPEWGNWAGVFFGVYFGHAGRAGGTVRVGDRLVVRQYADTRTGWPLVTKWLLTSVMVRLACAAL